MTHSVCCDLDVLWCWALAGCWLGAQQAQAWAGVGAGGRAGRWALGAGARGWRAEGRGLARTGEGVCGRARTGADGRWAHRQQAWARGRPRQARERAREHAAGRAGGRRADGRQRRAGRAGRAQQGCGRRVAWARGLGAGRVAWALGARPGRLGWPWAVHSVHSAHFRSVLTRCFS